MLRILRTRSIKQLIKKGSKPHEVAEAEEKEIVESYPKWGEIISRDTALDH